MSLPPVPDAETDGASADPDLIERVFHARGRGFSTRPGGSPQRANRRQDSQLPDAWHGGADQTMRPAAQGQPDPANQGSQDVEPRSSPRMNSRRLGDQLGHVASVASNADRLMLEWPTVRNLGGMSVAGAVVACAILPKRAHILAGGGAIGQDAFRGRERWLTDPGGSPWLSPPRGWATNERKPVMLISKKVNDAINQQIGNEFGASLQYVSIATYLVRRRD
jgi:hypothetical protein